MDTQTAVNLITQTFEADFDAPRFRTFARNLLNAIDETKAFGPLQGAYIWEAFRDHVHQYWRVGTYTDPDGEKIDVLIVRLKQVTSLERARTLQRNFVARYLKERDAKDAALVAYYTDDAPDWRFSLVKMEYQVEVGEKGVKVREVLTPARRYSFLVGANEPNHTAQQQLVPLLKETRHNPTLAQLEAAFNIESVTREFFEKYKALFLDLKEELDALVKSTPTIAAEFARAGIDTANFAKKLLGQLVFLTFLQKKGWLGVAPGAAWGSGPVDFLRRLLDRRYVAYDNFFNEVLEPLFYEALAVERADHHYAPLACRIPFLNGGLFEPAGGYDWRGVDIPLRNARFQAILDTFDLYNFTVREDEPLEKEVAVDPEMLGKVFENLLEVEDRKSKGAFYTPREIVHYMCQESLIHYLDTALNTPAAAPLRPPAPRQNAFFADPAPEQLDLTVAPPATAENDNNLPRADLETFIRRGDLALEHDAATATRPHETENYSFQLPAAIRAHAAALDAALAAIKICDPAIGSGAFPVGLMHEIVKARAILTPYLPLPPLGEGRGEDARAPYALKRHAIRHSLYGVDIDPGAVDIAKLRLWLSLVVDEDRYDRIQPLPNLDYKIVCGNSLLGFPFTSQRLDEIERLKQMYFDETDPDRKIALKAQTDALLAACFAASETSLGYRVDFDFKIYFSEVFREKGGFDVVIGNPPYVVSMDKLLRELYKESVYGRPNLYGFFIHCGINSLLRPGGVLTFINPRTLLTDAYTSALRRFILKHARVRLVLNIVNRRNVFESVLQATMVNIFEKSRIEAPIRVKNIDTKADLGKSNELKIPLDDFLFGETSPIFLVASSVYAYSVLRKLKSLKSFEQMGLSFTTGKIQWDLYKKVLSDRQATQSTRLIWAENIQRYQIGENKKRSDKLFINAPLKKCSPITDTTIIVQRITAVEQPRRIIATLVSPQEFGVPIQSENHTSYLESNSKGFDLRFVLGLMNSKLFDFIFRHTNSNTQVSAGELNALRLPRANEVLERDLAMLVERILAAKAADPAADVRALEAEIDRHVYRLYGLTAEEIAVVEGKS